MDIPGLGTIPDTLEDAQAMCMSLMRTQAEDTRLIREQDKALREAMGMIEGARTALNAVEKPGPVKA